MSDQPTDGNGHLVRTRETCNIPHSDDRLCPICDGGLGVCEFCGEYESGLDEPCIRQPTEKHEFVSHDHEPDCHRVITDGRTSPRYCLKSRDATVHQPSGAKSAAKDAGVFAEKCYVEQSRQSERIAELETENTSLKNVAEANINAGVEMAGRIRELEDAIIKTLDDNAELADGDVCTLIDLKRAVPEWDRAALKPKEGK